ncbi:hypothetical protein HPB50_025630 [Hyalomma asiaticum]|uniref:Uncharacterized protein n=1 Tax=Hyalomma asiaticum TaxID=266040 RepID=A0ACB7T9U4_HYAAI|nr:hypothetical protein HPB50_025630 [Hyalomma asiaticum]
MSASMEEEGAFDSLQDEVAFYREQAILYKAKWCEAQLELEEFQASSRDLEAELETQLKQYEASNRELRAMVTRLQADNESLQVGLPLHWRISSEFRCLVLQPSVNAQSGIWGTHANTAKS